MPPREESRHLEQTTCPGHLLAQSRTTKGGRQLTPSELAAACAFITQQTDEIVDLIRQIVAIESTSGDLQGSHAVVKLLTERAHFHLKRRRPIALQAASRAAQRYSARDERV